VVRCLPGKLRKDTDLSLPDLSLPGKVKSTNKMTSFSTFANQLARLTAAASEDLEAKLKKRVFKKCEYLSRKGID